jgi:CRISPR-associated protein Cas1
MQLLNTLYITTPETYLRLDNDTLRVEVCHETRLRVPLHHLTAVVCFGHINLSAPLMHRLADEGIALVLLDDNGRFKARLEGAVSGNVLLRQAQFQRVADPVFYFGHGPRQRGGQDQKHPAGVAARRPRSQVGG